MGGEGEIRKEIDNYHHEDCVYASLSDGGCYELHHDTIAEVDVEVGCGGHFEPVKLLESHLFVVCTRLGV